MRKIGCAAIGGMLLLFGMMVLFINILPGLMVEGFAQKLPAARPEIERWVLSGLPEGQEFDDSDVAFMNQILGPGYPYYGSGQVYAGGIVEFWNYVNLEPTFQCSMTSTRLTDCYGTARGVQWNDHSGIDYGIAANTPIQTPVGGVVTYAGQKGSYGNLVVIESNGYQMYFAHNNAVLVEVGQVVAAGDTIALAGSTGFATGPHIHFEVRKCDAETGYCSPVNPSTVILPGAGATCDFYFDNTVYVNWGSAEQIEFTCGVDEFGEFFIHYVCETVAQKSKPWCQ
ncbi:M23 family metallopeptidase [bacterium]|nr:M23 family metallopeptidase [bacterium]